MERVMRLHVRTVELDDDSPLLELLPEDPTEDRFSFVRADEGIVGWGVAERLSPGPGTARFTRAEELFAEVARRARVKDEVLSFGTGLIAFGSFAFDAMSDASVLVVPRVVIGRRHGVTWITTVETSDSATPRQAVPNRSAPPDRSSGRDGRPRFAGSSLREEDWLESVAEALRAIDRGALDKVVLARDQLLWSRREFDLPPLLGRLAARFPSCSTFLVDGLLGASPELLLSRRGSHVVSQVLAGTAARGVTPVEDRALSASLASSEKDLWEHALAVASVVEVLAPLCSGHRVPERPESLLLDNVQHLASRFEGELREPATSLGILQVLHPTAAVGGTPRDAALARIHSLERMDRGRYAAPVGWTSAGGDGEWAIALRCGLFEGTRARLYAGAGIVKGSLPEQELEETWLKLRAMREAIGT